MHKLFPLSFKGKGFRAVILSTLFYTLIFAVCTVVLGCIPLAGTAAIVLNVAHKLLLLYTVSGVVVSVLHSCDIV